MKLSVVFAGLLMITVSCFAQSTSTNSIEGARFLICYEGQPVCKIQGLEPTNSTFRQYQEPTESAARRLQTYFYLLSGCKIPIEHIDPTPTDKGVAYTIYIDIYAPSSGRYMPPTRIDLRSFSPTDKAPVLYISDAEHVHPLMKQDGKTTEILRPRVLLKQALDAFGQRYFGVPVSAIDDPKFDWSSHHTNTLAINCADFQPIQFPPASQ